MVQPIYDQERTRNAQVGPALRRALLFWRGILQQQISELKEWAVAAPKLCIIFVDAASTPARLAAVVAANGELCYSDAPPSRELLERLTIRGDNQIMSLVRGAGVVNALALRGFLGSARK